MTLPYCGSSNERVVSGGVKLGISPNGTSPLKKRKLEQSSPSNESPITESKAGQIVVASDSSKESTSIDDRGTPAEPATQHAAILPLPLPSKRYKKSSLPKAVLIPVEKLPVYALPPLPRINDPNLKKMVFTHISLCPKSKGLFEDPVGRPAEHYEKLEHVGDSILGMVVTTWLHEMEPRLTCGTATKLKAHLVSNATLSHLSGLYHLPHKLRADPQQLPVLKATTDIRAALMEAYIAAVYLSFPLETRFSEGLKAIDTWLRAMYEPMHDFFIRYMREEYSQHHLTHTTTINGAPTLLTPEQMTKIDDASQGMANLLQQYCYRQEKELKYKEESFETHCGTLWKLKCMINGEEYGEATRSGRRVAKNVSAWEACKRLGLVEEDEERVNDEKQPAIAAGPISGASVIDTQPSS